MVFINKLDTASARVSEVLAALQSVSARPLVLRQVPLPGAENSIAGYVDLVSERGYKYKPGPGLRPHQAAGGRAPRRSKRSRAGLVEKLADFDDKLLEQLLEDVQPSKEEIYRHLTQNLRRDPIVPVFLGAAQHDHGVRRLWKALRHETPGVADRRPSAWASTRRARTRWRRSSRPITRRIPASCRWCGYGAAR